MHIELITSEGSAFSGDAVSITLPSGNGEITVLEHHIPLLTTVEPGTVIIRAGGEDQLFAVSRGVVQVSEGNIRILSDIADRAESLEEEAIELARERAVKLRDARRGSDEEFVEAQAMLEREIARITTIHRFKSHRRRRV